MEARMAAFKEYRQFDAVGLAALIRGGEVSAAEVLEAAIERVETVNPQLNAVVHTQFERARRQAAEGLPDGPLSGVPFMLKDLGAYDAGEPSTSGSRLFADFVPNHDATYVERCKAAGLNIMARTNTPEMGLNANTEPVLFGSTRNPWHLDYSAAGSSGGSASAVAAGMVPVAHATDGGGSIRLPAANNGLFGLKPTRARNPAGPDVGEGWSGMSTGHVVSRSVRDSAVMLDCTHGPAAGDPYCAPPPARPFAEEVGADPGRLRVAVLTHGYDGSALDPECVRGVEATAKLLEGLGHAVEAAGPDIDMPAVDMAVRTVIAANVWNLVQLRSQALGREPSGQDVEPVTWAYAQEGRAASAGDYARALMVMHGQGRRMAAFFEDYDVIVSSCFRAPPLKLGALDMTNPDIEDYHEKLFRQAIPFTPIYNVTGCPAASVPLHWTTDGLPVGIHFGAGFGREDILLRLAGQLEQAQPWFDRVPDL
jgi:amidase